ncbi:zinc finger protein 40 isoform X2 [Hyposmocoma kahamanoa]|uniref:zinc finger protein 40 isoform X2 n=1 Tax=Hyposmocoma kahamanoa TaxID=1477025 RepID=UPI000E6DA126|nr:zinc finger protein 40 isoform X2 [Hyposmocoma kahamanoa]
MPLTQDKRLDDNFSNNNDHSYLHKKFKKMATTMSPLSASHLKGGVSRHLETSVAHSACNTSISNGSIAAAHPEIEKIKERELVNVIDVENNVQTNLNKDSCRLSDVNNIVQVSGQTSVTDEFLNKTENVENDFIRDSINGGTGGRYICPYCKLSCAKPSVLQKHIRAHTNERPYPCVPCGFAFKTKSNLYKHRRSRTHALRLQGADVSSMNDEDLSGGSESDTSMPSLSISDTGSEPSIIRFENSRPSEFSSPELTSDIAVPLLSMNTSSADNSKSKTIYKPKFRAALYQESDERDKLKRTISQNADFLTEHISKIISDNEAIVDVIDTPLQKKYGKIKQIAESKQFLNEIDIKQEPSPLNLTKNNHEMETPFRKRSHSETFTHIDYHKHPLNPEGSIIKDLLLKTKGNGLVPVAGEIVDGMGSLFACPLCQIIYRSAENLEVHRMYYCKGNVANSIVSSTNVQKESVKAVRPENVFVRSNSIHVRLPETPSGVFPKVNRSPPLKSKPGPLLGHTRLVDTRPSSDLNRKTEIIKLKPALSPKRRLDSRSDTYSPRSIENISPRSTDLYPQPKIRCFETSSVTLRPIEELSPHMRHNTTSLQMFGGEVKIVDHSGGTTTLRIEPSKNQLSPILIQQNLSPSKIANDTEASSVVVRSGLHSGGTIVHNPPTPKEIITTPQSKTPRISMANAPIISNIPNIHDVTHFQFPPLSAITAYNPLTLPPLSPSSSPSGTSTILHGGKLIPHVPGIPGPNTPGLFIGNPKLQSKTANNDNKTLLSPSENVHGGLVQTVKVTFASKYDSIRNVKSPIRSLHNEAEKGQENSYGIESPHQNMSPIPIIKIKNVDDSSILPKIYSNNIIKPVIGRQDIAIKRNAEGIPRTTILKETTTYPINKIKNKCNVTLFSKHIDSKQEEIRNFNFENLITKAEIYNNQIPSSSEVQKNTNAQESLGVPIQNERSETSYFQKSSSTKITADERKPKFLRPSTLPLKPGTFTPKKHHGITPNANTMPLVSPETPRPAKAYGQLYLNGNAYTYLGLKCSTKVFYCTINRPQPTYVPNQHFLSMYSNWQLLSELTPDPLGLSASSAMSLYDSRHRPQSVAVAVIKQDLILTHSSQWNTNLNDHKEMLSLESKLSEDTKVQHPDNVPKKELTGGFESNEEYTYVRGRGRGRYVCSECGIRCKKPSMLKKHIRTHTDVRPYTCIHCAFSFKTKGNLTKHMKSKAHYKKCCELGINPNEGNDIESGETVQSGETDDDTDTDGDEGNEGETESSDTEVSKSRLPEHEAAHCLLSLGGSRPATSATPGLITSARPCTYPYTPTGLESTSTLDFNSERLQISRCSSVESRSTTDNEPMDLSKNEVKPSGNNLTEIPTARESSVLASLASNTAKLPQSQSQWPNGEPMLHTYLTERALFDSKIKQSQLTGNLSKARKIDLEKPLFVENGSNHVAIVTSSNSPIPSTTGSPRIDGPLKVVNLCENDNSHKNMTISKEDSTIPSKDVSVTLNVSTESRQIRVQSTSNAENAKHVVSEYLKHARMNLTKNHDDNPTLQNDNMCEINNTKRTNMEETTKEELNSIEHDSMKLSPLEIDPVARKVVIGVGGVAFKVSNRKEFENTSYSPGKLMEDGRRVCDFCNKTFTKPSQLRLHLNIHYMERPFRCGVCAVSFRTRGHLQKHERSGSHHNKVSMTSTFGAATSFNPRPFRCSDCNIAFRIHGHLAKHLRSKMHVMRLECLFKLPFGTFTEIERAGVSLTDIDTTDCASSLASLQSLARKLHEKDPTKLEYREPSTIGAPSAGKESSDDEEGILASEKMCDNEKDSEMKNIDSSEHQRKETQVNYSATDN